MSTSRIIRTTIAPAAALTKSRLASVVQLKIWIGSAVKESNKPPGLNRGETAAPMITRRVVEALGDLVGKRAQVEAFFDAQAESLASVPAALKQTRERMRLDEDMQKRAAPEVSAWLANR